jgi:bifunctional ADP-heptose synthase (sugar kinase/adenylyltransferase)
MESSAALGDCLVVAVMADTWLTRKTGRAFMEFADRAAVVAALRGVDHVVCWDDGTPFVDGLIRILRPRIFAKGGDRSTAAAIAAPERDACRQCGTFLALGVGGTDKVQSSSVILSRARIP